MKKVDGFFILILVLVSALAGLQYHVSYSPSFVENNSELTARYERQKELQKLDRALAEIKVVQSDNVGRSPASINRRSNVVNSVSSIGTSDELTSETPEWHFKEVKRLCIERTAQLECLNKIDLIVTQFPETLWAAESLLILAEVYRLNNEMRKAHNVIEVIRSRFAVHKAVQAKVEYLEKLML